MGIPTESEEDRSAIVELVRDQSAIAKKLGVDRPLIKVDANPLVPKWQTPLKNWVYNYLPNRQTQFHELLIRIRARLEKVPNVKPKKVCFHEFLAQTWLTHLEFPINSMTMNLPLDSHNKVSLFGGYPYLKDFQVKLNRMLQDIWKRFELSKWEVYHRIKATNHSDEFFSKEYLALIHQH